MTSRGTSPAAEIRIGWQPTGPAESTAWVVQRLVDAGASMVGKTITDELTRGIFGENVHYGTPINPRAPVASRAVRPAAPRRQWPASW